METSDRHRRIQELTDSGEQISIRELVSMWGASGRGQVILDTIESELREVGVAAEPPLEWGGLDSRIRLSRESTSSRGPYSPGLRRSGTLAVGVIPSSRVDLTTVRRSTSLAEAQLTMIRYDFSQLPVVDRYGRLRGVISWESIARASVAGSPAVVNDCLIPAATVQLGSDLFDCIPTIIDSGHVIVLDEKARPSGIITTADLANQFDSLARPFLLVGESERELRRVLDANFSSEVLEAASKWGAKNGQSGAAAMTIGEIKNFLSNSDNWEQLGWPFPQELILDWITVLNRLRNEVAHFHNDAEEIRPRLLEVRNLTNWLRSL